MNQMKGTFPASFFQLCLLTVLWALMAWFYRSADVLPLPPGHIHGWRQADCASLTRNFYEENLPVWEPRVHYAKEDGSGKAVGEFPVLNYATAKIMKVTGFSWTAQRAVVLFCCWLAVTGLFLWLGEEFGAAWPALWISLLLFTSPIFVYYGCSYLPDVPSAALALWALWADARFRRTGNRTYGISSALLVCTAVLVKVSSGVVWVTLLCMLASRWFFAPDRKKAALKNLPVYLVHGVSAILVWQWYAYAHRYDFARKPMIFLTHIRPYWETHPDEFSIINRQIFDVWLPDYFHISVWITAAAAFLANLYLTRKNRDLFLLNLLVPLGFFAFLVLMYKQLYWHDYYLVIPVLAPVLVIGICVCSLWRLWPHKGARVAVGLFVLGLSVFNMRHAGETVVRRYFGTEYRFADYDLEELRPILRQKGVPRTDLMIVVPDISPNNSLVLADQYGYSNFMGTNDSIQDVERHIRLGAKWLTVTDTAYLHKDFLKPFTHDTFTVYKGIHVFQLKEQ